MTDLAVDQSSRGREVHVIASRQLYDDLTQDLPAESIHKGVAVHRVWTSRFGRANLWGRAIDYLTFYFGAGICLFDLTKRGDLLVAKTDPPLISVVAGWVARAKHAHLVNWLQDI